MNALEKDERPWLTVAKDVKAGKHDTAKGSRLEAILIGLGAVKHPDFLGAVAYLNERMNRYAR